MCMFMERWPLCGTLEALSLPTGRGWGWSSGPRMADMMARSRGRPTLHGQCLCVFVRTAVGSEATEERVVVGQVSAFFPSLYWHTLRT